MVCCRPSGLPWEDKYSSHTALEGRSPLVMSGRASRIPRRRQTVEGRRPKDSQTAGLEDAGGAASLVYSLEMDLSAAGIPELDFGVESLTAS